MFTKDEIRIANATSRTNGASAKNKDGSVRAVVPKYVAQYINKEEIPLFVNFIHLSMGKRALYGDSGS